MTLAINWVKKSTSEDGMITMYRFSKKETGFTLVEMMIVVAVFAVMAAIAIPTFMSLLPGMRLNDAARDIFVALNQARMGAAAKNTAGNVRLDTGTSWTAWLDDGSAGINYWYNGNTTPPDTLIKEGTTESGVTISYDKGNTYAFNSRGLPAVGTPAGIRTITLTNSEGDTRQIQINALGSVKIL
jgi:prepilin-type N-terminal cleavage/methylation domain-containing protein